MHRHWLLFGLLVPGALGVLVASPLTGAVTPAATRLDLETAIRIGAANSFALRSISHRTAAAQALVSERWRDYLPRIGVGVSRTRTITVDERDAVTNDIRLTVEQVLYDGGARELGLDLARIDQLLAREDFRISYNQLRLEVQRAFLQALAAEGKILLNAKSLERANLQLKQARTEERVGFARRVDVYSVAARVREVELRLAESRNEYRQNIAELRRTLLLDHSAPVIPDGNLLRDYFLRPPSVEVDRLVESALRQRPEVTRAEADIRRRQMERRIEENSWVPRVSLNGYVARSGPEYPVREQNWGVGLTITFPIGSTTTSSTAAFDSLNDGTARSGTTGSQIDFFDDLGYDRRVLQSRIALAEAIDANNKLRTDLAIEIGRQVDALQEAWEAIRIGNGRVYFNFASFKILEQRYQVGEIRREDIVEAEIELVRAQQDLIDAITEYMVTAATLEFAAALEPGELSLVIHQPGEGNIILAHLLTGDFEDLRNVPAEGVDQQSIREMLDRDPRAEQPGEEDYLIERVPLE